MCLLLFLFWIQPGLNSAKEIDICDSPTAEQHFDVHAPPSAAAELGPFSDPIAASTAVAIQLEPDGLPVALPECENHEIQDFDLFEQHDFDEREIDNNGSALLHSRVASRATHTRKPRFVRSTLWRFEIDQN